MSEKSIFENIEGNNQPRPWDAVRGGQSEIPSTSAILGGIAGAKHLLNQKNPEVQKVGLARMANYGQAGLVAIYNFYQTSQEPSLKKLAAESIESEKLKILVPNLIAELLTTDPDFLAIKKLAIETKTELEKLKEKQTVQNVLDIMVTKVSTISSGSGIFFNYYSPEYFDLERKMKFLKREIADLDKQINYIDNNPNLLEWIFQNVSRTRDEFKKSYLSKVREFYKCEKELEGKQTQAKLKFEETREHIETILNLLTEFRRNIGGYGISFSWDILHEIDNNNYNITLQTFITKFEKILDKTINPKAEDYVINLDT